MGIIFGSSVGKELPSHTLRSIPYEIRIYDTCFVAETTASDSNEAFGRLAKYFGVFGSPDNNTDELVSTASFGESVAGVPMEGRGVKIAMTVPVLTNCNTTQFHLPAIYKRISEIPTPTDPNIHIKRIPKRSVAVLTFCGYARPTRVQNKVKELLQMLIDDELIDIPTQERESRVSATSSAQTVDWSTPLIPTPSAHTIPFQIAHYNSPYTLPCCRRVEVWITLDPEQDRVSELLKCVDDPAYSTRAAVDTLMDCNYFDDPLDAEYGSENEEVAQQLAVHTHPKRTPLSTHITHTTPTTQPVHTTHTTPTPTTHTTHTKRRGSNVISTAEKFLISPDKHKT